MRNYFTFLRISFLYLLVVFPAAWADTNNITVDDPLSSAQQAVLTGVYGSNFVGTYVGKDTATYSFLTDGTNYTILNDNPLAQSASTLANGISGSTIFGQYTDAGGLIHGFLNAVNSSNYVTITSPLGVQGTAVADVSGNYAIGSFVDALSGTNDFLYNGTNFTTLNDTNGVSNSTVAVALEGGSVVGNYLDISGNSFGFYFDGTNYTTVDYGADTNNPLAINTGTTSLIGLSGGTLAGNAQDTSSTLHGFLWDITTATFTPIDVDSSGVLPTWITGFSGNFVVGNTEDSLGVTNGFLTTNGGVGFITIVPPAATNGSYVLGVGGGTIYGTFQDTNLVTHSFVTSDGSSYTVIDGPPSGTTVLSASSNASGTNAVGSYTDVAGILHFYFFDGTSYSTLEYSNATSGSLVVTAVSGTNVAGTYTDTTSGFTYGFVYNGSKYTPITGPAGAGGAGISAIAGISSTNIAGTYADATTGNTYGFICSTKGVGYAVIVGPQGPSAFDNGGGLNSVDGISGLTVYGTYTDTNSFSRYGFKYVAGTYTTIYGPDGTNGSGITTMNGLSAGVTVGTYVDSTTGLNAGFILNGVNYTTLYGPEGTNGGGVDSIIGISGNNVVGTYHDSNNVLHGFLYNGANYSVIDFPGALPEQTTVSGVLGNMIYGGYSDTYGLTHGFYIQRGSQSIGTYTISSTNFSVPNPTVTLPLTNSFGLPISYTVLSGSASVAGNLLTFTGAGTVTVQASQPGNSAYYAATPLTNSVNIARGSQTITFGAVTNQVYGVPFTVSPTASSGLQVSVSILSGSATNSGTNGATITPTGVGTLVLAADQSGDSNYLPAAQATRSAIVLQATQSIAPFTGITNIPFTTNPVTITIPAASSGLPVALAAGGVGTNTGNQVTLLGAGTVTLTASQSGNSNYLAASSVSTNFLVTKGAQSLAAFGTIGAKTFGDAPFAVATPVASSGLPSTLSVLSGPATLSNTTVTITGAGTVTLAADQAGNVNYNAAAQVTTSFSVGKASQSISQFVTIPNRQGLSPVTITNPPVASSGLPVTLTVQSGAATISGNTVTPTNSPTTIVLAANQPGNSNYLAASEVTTSFSDGKTDQSFTNSFAPIPNQAYSTNGIVIIPPSASSALPASVTVISGPASLSGNTLSITGVGTVVLAANQSGDATYGPAGQIITSFTITQAPQTIQPFATITNHVYRDSPFLVSVPTGGNSGQPVTLSILAGPATLSNNTLSMTGAGTVTVAANQSGDANYQAAPQVSTSFVVAKASQQIAAFTNIPIRIKTPGPVVITPPTGGDSGQPVIVSVVSDTNTVTYNPTNNTVTPTKKGVVVLAANQAGDANYLDAPQVTTSFLVTLLPQSIGAFSGKITNASIPFTPKAFAIAVPKATSTLPVKLSVLSGPAKFSQGMLVLLGTGDVTLAADQAGNGKFAPAPRKSISFTVSLGTQTIASFMGIKKKIAYTPKPFSVVIPKATSGLPVTLIASGPATISSNNVISLTGIGTVTLTATNAGSTNYFPAVRSTNFTVTLAPQTIKPFHAIPTQSNGVSFTLTNVPTASSGLPVAVSVFSGSASIATNSPTSYTITPNAVGKVTLAADQAGNPTYSNYLRAPTVKISFSVK